MKTLRLFLWFVVGFLVSAAAVLAHAETINATDTGNFNWKSGYTVVTTIGPFQTVAEATCRQFYIYNSYLAATFSSVVSQEATYQTGTNIVCRGMEPAGSRDRESINLSKQGSLYSCPTGQNWSLNGSTCSRPDCVAPQVRDAADGVCKAPATPCEMFPGSASTPSDQPANCSCPAGTQWVPLSGCRKKCDSSQSAGTAANAGWGLSIAKGQTEGCFAGCGIQHVAGAYDIMKDGSHLAAATYTGWACSGNGPGTAPTSDNQPQPDSPKVKDSDKKPPKCGAGEGVITSSSGNVLCLPAGTPNTSTPKVATDKKTETYPDASTKVTEVTKTTDPNTGATHISTSTTSSGGQAGPAGTTTGTENSTGTDGNGDGEGDGDCDPTLQMCGSPATTGLYEKKSKTFDDVMGTFSTGFKNSEFGQAAGDFFTITNRNGSCPHWVFNVDYLNTTVDIGQYFCSSAAQSMMGMVGLVLLFVASFVGFRWAIL